MITLELRTALRVAARELGRPVSEVASALGVTLHHVQKCDLCGAPFLVGLGTSRRGKRFCKDSHRAMWNDPKKREAWGRNHVQF